MRKAEALKDEGAIRELREVGPPPYPDGRGYRVQRKWSNFFEGADAFIASMVGFAFGAPGYTLRDVNDWFDGQNVSGEALVPQTSVLAARTLAGDFAVPVFVIQGAEDFTTPTSLARSFVDSIRAPAKAFVPIGICTVGPSPTTALRGGFMKKKRRWSSFFAPGMPISARWSK